MKWVILLFLAAILSSESHAQKTTQDVMHHIDEMRYGDLRKIEYFGVMFSYLKDKETAKNLGITDEDMTDFVKLRFKNNFVNVPYKNIVPHISDVKNKESVGYLECGVWAVGDDFPIAFHVICNGGSLENSKIFTDEVLGYGSKNDVKEAIKKSLDNIISKFALQFFKIRGEL